MRLVCLAFLSFFALPGVTALRAQSVHWDPPGGSLPVGQSTALRLVFENCAPKDEPVPPKVDGLTLQLYGKGSNTSIVNGSMTVSETFTFAAALTKTSGSRSPPSPSRPTRATSACPPPASTPAPPPSAVPARP